MALSLDKLSILVVEDVAPMRQLLMVILQTLGIGTVLAANDGTEGYEVFVTKDPILSLPTGIWNPWTALN